jgi:hypothetical protein
MCVYVFTLWPWLTGRGEVPAVTSYNITSLSPGTSYIFRIYSLVQGVENNYVEVVYRTLAQDAGAGTLPPGRTLRACACACASPLSLSLCVCVPHTTPLLCMDTHTHTHSLSLCVCLYCWTLTCMHGCGAAEIGVSTALIGGVIAGVVILFVLVIVGFTLNKRALEKKQKKLLEEYSSQLQMVRPLLSCTHSLTPSLMHACVHTLA